jgi:hypothetical protein
MNATPGVISCVWNGNLSYIDRWNADPTPFVWTREPAAIIKNAIRRVR